MTLGPSLRKWALTTHVALSVGWLGAVVSFLALAIAGLNSEDPLRVRTAYVGMEMLGWYVIVPLNGGALLSGLVQSLGTQWGLFRHYWVLIKLMLTVVATALLLLHMQPIGVMARAAQRAAESSPHLRELRVQLIADAGAAVALLLVIIALSVIKPRGLTRYGRNRARAEAASTGP